MRVTTIQSSFCSFHHTAQTMVTLTTHSFYFQNAYLLGCPMCIHSASKIIFGAIELLCMLAKGESRAADTKGGQLIEVKVMQ